MMNNNISECNNNITHTYILSNTTVNNMTCIVLGHTYISSNTTVNNMTNTVKNVGCDGRWPPKEKEPPRTRSSGVIPEEPARSCMTRRPTPPSSDGRARPPPGHAAYDPLGAGCLRTDCGSRDRHQRRSGSMMYKTRIPH